MGLLRDELEKVKQEKVGFEFKIAKFDKSAKDLEQLLAKFKLPESNSQLNDKDLLLWMSRTCLVIYDHLSNFNELLLEVMLTFGGGAIGGRITDKLTIKMGLFLLILQIQMSYMVRLMRRKGDSWMIASLRLMVLYDHKLIRQGQEVNSGSRELVMVVAEVNNDSMKIGDQTRRMNSYSERISLVHLYEGMDSSENKTVVATSTTDVIYVAAATLLWTGYLIKNGIEKGSEAVSNDGQRKKECREKVKTRQGKSHNDSGLAKKKSKKELEQESEKKKSPEKSPEKIEEEDVATQKEMKEVSKETRAKRKKSIPRKSTRKRQRWRSCLRKEELKGFLDINTKRREVRRKCFKESQQRKKIVRFNSEETCDLNGPNSSLGRSA
ncbi:hypothetical protein Tco_0073816 [Tanacetum coccineum]